MMTRIFQLGIVGVLLFISPADSWAGKNYRVVVFCDSIMGGYQLQEQDAFPFRLERKLRAAGYDRLEVVNMCKDNASTASATTETDAVAQQLPDVIILQLGYNDTKRGVLPSAIASNLNTIIANLKRSNAYIILVGIPAPENPRDENYKEMVAGYFSNLASSFKVPYYPSAIEGIENNPSLTMADGMHPNAAGVEVMVTGVLPMVDEGLRWRYEVYLDEMKELQKTQQNIIATPPPP